MLHTGRAVGNLGEVIATQFLLLLHTEGTMVRRDHLQIVHLQTFPQLSLVRFVTQGRSHYVLRAFKVITVVIDRKEQVLRTRFSERRYSAIARLTHLMQRVSTRKVND